MNGPDEGHYIKRVMCEVKNCKFNQQECCTAQKIHVAPQHACCASDTACATFQAVAPEKPL